MARGGRAFFEMRGAGQAECWPPLNENDVTARLGEMGLVSLLETETSLASNGIQTWKMEAAPGPHRADVLASAFRAIGALHGELNARNY